MEQSEVAEPDQHKPGSVSIEVVIQDAEPRAFELVLSYIYTDRIHPRRKAEDLSSNEVTSLMMDVYRLALKVRKSIKLHCN